MNQLKLVWELEKYNGIIDECKADLFKLENSNRLKNMNKRMVELDSNINHVRERILENNKSTSKFERLLKEYDYTKMKLEEDLYSGEISDIKQLEQLSMDKEKTFELIDEVESKILKLIDDNEVLEENYGAIRNDYEKLKGDIEITKKQFNELVQKLRAEIHIAEQEKDKVLPKIDGKILKRYDTTRAKRGKGIVPVNDDICGGCNVRIPTYLMVDIKKQTEIIYCDSCGRLLYYMEN